MSVDSTLLEAHDLLAAAADPWRAESTQALLEEPGRRDAVRRWLTATRLPDTGRDVDRTAAVRVAVAFAAAHGLLDVVCLRSAQACASRAAYELGELSAAIAHHSQRRAAAMPWRSWSG